MAKNSATFEQRDAKRIGVIGDMVSAKPDTKTIEEDFQTVAGVVIPSKGELKSRRKGILLRPSVHDAAQAKCDRMGISFNEVINQLLANWVKD